MLTREKIIDIIMNELEHREAQDRLPDQLITAQLAADRIYRGITMIPLPHSREQATGMIRVASSFLDNEAHAKDSINEPGSTPEDKV